MIETMKDDFIILTSSSTNIPKKMIMNFEIFRTLGWKDFEVEKGLENGKLAKEIIKLAEQMFNHQSLNTKIHFGDVKFWEMTARWLNATPPIPADDLGFINFSIKCAVLEGESLFEFEVFFILNWLLAYHHETVLSIK